MIDGPTSQLDTMEFTGFQDIEEEKKGEFRSIVRVSSTCLHLSCLTLIDVCH